MKKRVKDMSKKEVFELLKRSRIERERVVAKFGSSWFSSVWDIDPKFRSIFLDVKSWGRRYVDVSNKIVKERNLERFGDAIQKALGSSGASARNGALSVLPLDMVMRVMILYSKKGDWVLNPCMGDTTTLVSAYLLGRNYVAVDPSSEMVEWNKGALKLLEENGDVLRYKPEVRLYKDTAENLHRYVDEESMDFAFTSPPYWDIEDYRTGKEEDDRLQAGIGKSYEEFLGIMKKIYSEVYRALKPGAFFVVNVNDFRKNKKFYAYHIDTWKLLEEVGFKPHDIIIWKMKSSLGKVFWKEYVNEWKIMPKIHEYNLVFRKE